MNRQIVLRRHTRGPLSASDLSIVERPVPEPAEGEVLMRTLYIAVDGWIGLSLAGRHLQGEVELGDVVPGEAVGRVVRSRHPDFAEGDIARAPTGWRDFAVVRPLAPPAPKGLAAALRPSVSRIQPDPRVPLSAYLGLLGLPGLAAYAGMAGVLRPGPGETVVVSAIERAVGSAAAQIARIMGARTVGIAGTPEGTDHAMTRLRLDACVRHTDGVLGHTLDEACPEGIDAHFATVGGSVLSIVLRHLSVGGRVLLCDLADPGAAPGADGPQRPGLEPILARRAQVTGFSVYDHLDGQSRWRHLAAGWIADGRLGVHEDRGAGLEAAPSMLVRALSGRSVGQAIVVVAPEEEPSLVAALR